MSNWFHVWAHDNQGNSLPSAQFTVYDDFACTTVSTLVESQPVTTDTNGEADFHHLTARVLFVKMAGSSVVEPVRCINEPLLTDFALVTPTLNDSVGVADDDSGSANKRALLSAVKTLFGLPTGAVDGNYLGTPQTLTLWVMTTDPVVGDLDNGDVVFKVS